MGFILREPLTIESEVIVQEHRVERAVSISILVSSGIELGRPGDALGEVRLGVLQVKTMAVCENSRRLRNGRRLYC